MKKVKFEYYINDEQEIKARAGVFAVLDSVNVKKCNFSIEAVETKDITIFSLNKLLKE